MSYNIDIEFNEECILEHNRLRRLHGCPELTLDYELASAAQQYAEYLASANELEHCTDTESGENLAFFTTSAVAHKEDFTGVDVTKSWYQEIADYDFRKENQFSCGHFTQVIWLSTITAGFGRAFSKDLHSIYVVGRYDPPGNFSGEFSENVPPLITNNQ
ncbi:hypothetical protein MN116_000513 [Schistosoma mekongi]|uniref:SCP domain-containing protein n=1 Tax=Schistosoma mekongi TaxID=38744 RepID=A0AAE2D5Q5_SCHME|nr:hypothetical protein MN116_000513 [Schistosoma mekongi]